VRAGHFSEGIFETASEDLYLYGLAALGNFRKNYSERTHSVQASQNQLAEPFKYSNSLRTSSTIVCCIPLWTADENGRQGCRRAWRCLKSSSWRDPWLRSRFRLRARTPAERLNLSKRLAASTLETFQRE